MRLAPVPSAQCALSQLPPGSAPREAAPASRCSAPRLGMCGGSAQRSRKVRATSGACARPGPHLPAPGLPLPSRSQGTAVRPRASAPGPAAKLRSSAAGYETPKIFTEGRRKIIVKKNYSPTPQKTQTKTTKKGKTNQPNPKQTDRSHCHLQPRRRLRTAAPRRCPTRAPPARPGPDAERCAALHGPFRPPGAAPRPVYGRGKRKRRRRRGPVRRRWRPRARSYLRPRRRLRLRYSGGSRRSDPPPLCPLRPPAAAAAARRRRPARPGPRGPPPPRHRPAPHRPRHRHRPRGTGTGQRDVRRRRAPAGAPGTGTGPRVLGAGTAPGRQRLSWTLMGAGQRAVARAACRQRARTTARAFAPPRHGALGLGQMQALLGLTRGARTSGGRWRWASGNPARYRALVPGFSNARQAPDASPPFLVPQCPPPLLLQRWVTAPGPP